MNPNVLWDTTPWERPPDAGERIREVLADPHMEVSERVLAAELSGNIVAMSDEVGAALMAVLQEAGELVKLRARAAIAFGLVLEEGDLNGFDDLQSVPVSERTYLNIRTASTSGERQWALTAVFAMRWVKGFGRQILEALNNVEAEIHCGAVWTKVATVFPAPAKALQAMKRLSIEFSAVQQEAALAAALAWEVYRSRGGRRERVVADFLLGSHAQIQAER